MRLTARRLFFVWDFEKEERWLNEMASKGMNLQGVSICSYVFEEGTPGEYQYHVEWLKYRPSHLESVAYIRFLEETGVEHIGSLMNWVYFRKKRADGAFDLSSDLDARIDHFKRISWLLWVLLPCVLIFIASQIYQCLTHKGVLPALMPLIVLDILILACITMGLVKTRLTYRRLKKERLLRE